MTTSPPSSSEAADVPLSSAFNRLHQRVQRWVWERGWKKLREIQEKAIGPLLDSDRDVILAATTAAGKTEAAFLPLCSQLIGEGGGSIRVLCVSPLKALINDQFRRLEDLCAALDVPVHRWHGDVPTTAKRKVSLSPDGILLITPESLEALFVLQGHRIASMFAKLDAIILDELHAYIGTPRGSQLQSLLHRVEYALRRRVRRVGLSATLGDMSLAARFLRPTSPDEVVLIESTADGKDILLQIRGYRDLPPSQSAGKAEVEVSALAADDDASSAAISEHLFKQLRGGHHLVFANSRKTVERYSDRLRRMSEQVHVPNEFFPHHGSLSKELREDVEARLKESSLPATAICTSTLELGIDIGDVQSIAQIGTPFSVASLRQRLGRSGRRGEPATLRFYISEPEVRPSSPVLDTLHTDLVQAIAMVELLLDRWCEPPELGAIQLSTLIQQVLSIIAQHGGVTASEAWTVLCKGGPFASVGKEHFMALLRCMGASDLIQQSAEGTLIHGSKGERIVEHYSFYAVFATPEEFRVESGGHALGSMAFDISIAVGLFIIFGGRRWRIVEIDLQAKVVSVTPAPGGRVPHFSGSRGGLVHDRIRTTMREVYESGVVYPYLNDGARVMLTEARRAYVRLGLDSRLCVPDGRDTVVFLCRGDRILNTVSVLLLARGVKLDVTGPGITVHETTPDEVLDCLRAVSTEPVPSGEELAARVANKATEKYDWVLDETLLRLSYASQNLAVPDSIASLRAVMRLPSNQL